MTSVKPKRADRFYNGTNTKRGGMQIPDFFREVPVIRMIDPLAEMLGACDGGIFEYTYEDAVKLAGHSCPTVAGVYLMLLRGLEELYPDRTPERGAIRVFFRGSFGDGTVGVSAAIATLITGATDRGGFQGIGGRFDRRNLLVFDSSIDGELALERTDTGKKVVLSYDPSSIPSDPSVSRMIDDILSGTADAENRARFAAAWQARVRTILIDRRDNPGLISCRFTYLGDDR